MDALNYDLNFVFVFVGEKTNTSPSRVPELTVDRSGLEQRLAVGAAGPPGCTPGRSRTTVMCPHHVSNSLPSGVQTLDKKPTRRKKVKFNYSQSHGLIFLDFFFLPKVSKF